MLRKPDAFVHMLFAFSEIQLRGLSRSYRMASTSSGFLQRLSSFMFRDKAPQAAFEVRLSAAVRCIIVFREKFGRSATLDLVAAWHNMDHIKVPSCFRVRTAGCTAGRWWW